MFNDNMLDNFRSAIENRECAGELGAVVEQLMTGAVAVLDVDGALLVLLDESETPALVASCFVEAPTESTVRGLVAASGEVIREGRILTCPDDPLPGPTRGAGAVLAVPFPVGDRAFGALTLYRLRSAPWDPEETRAVHAYARLVRLLLKHAASVNRPAGGDWCAPLMPQQLPGRLSVLAAPTWSPSGS